MNTGGIRFVPFSFHSILIIQLNFILCQLQTLERPQEQGGQEI